MGLVRLKPPPKKRKMTKLRQINDTALLVNKNCARKISMKYLSPPM